MMSSHWSMLCPHLAFSSSPSAIKIWGFPEFHYPSVALKAFEHSSQLMVNSAFLSGVRRVLLGCSTAHSLGSVIAKVKLCLNYFIIIFLQCLRLIDVSVVSSQKLHSQEGRTVSHCLGEGRETGKQYCHR